MSSEDLFIHSLNSISSIDGRYHKDTKILSEYFSEFAYHKYRIFVEIEYFKHLSHWSIIRGLQKEEVKFLDSIHCDFNIGDAQLIQNIEQFGVDGNPPLNHDVKAIEVFIRNKLKNTTLEPLTEMIHFGVTSEDINNLATNLMLRDGLKIFYREIDNLICLFLVLAKREKDTPMLSRTHGQPAVPTTLGKEFVFYAFRLKKSLEYLQSAQRIISGKLNGAVGNYNSFSFCNDNINWIDFSKSFVNYLGFDFNLITNQIEPHDCLMGVFSGLMSVGNIIRDFSINLWSYISLGYFTQKNVDGEVGSSVMPHKINPWRLENAEGMTLEANGKLITFMQKLQTSRFQRDLSDHAFLRNIGVPISFILVATKNVQRELKRLDVCRDNIHKDLKKFPEVVSEGIQTLLRLEGVVNSYDIVKNIFKGEINYEKLNELLQSLRAEVREKIEFLINNPETYVGLASRLVEDAIQDIDKFGFYVKLME